MKKNYSLALTLTACVAVLAPPGGWAQSTWGGGTSVDWSEASNWSPSGVPSSVDAVVNTSSGNLATVLTDVTGNPVNTLKIGDRVVGAMIVQSGGNLLVNGETWVGNTITGNGVLSLSGGVCTAHNWFAVGRGGGHATVDMTGGSLNCDGNPLVTGIDNGSVGVFNQSAGEIACGSDFWVANSSGATGTYNLSGTGSLTVNSWLVIGRAGGTGTLNISGGSITKTSDNGNQFLIGVDQNDSLGTINQTGGAITNVMSDTHIGSYNAGTGIWNLNGGLAVLSTVIFCKSGNSIGTLNLNPSGTMIAGEITSATAGANSTLNFNGGTLIGSQNNGNFLHGLKRVNVRNGGVIINDGGFTIGLPQDLTHSVIGGDNAKDGGLTKTGSGTLQLSGVNSYNGDTIVSGGTLEFDTTGSVPSTLRLASGTFLNLNYSGEYAVAGLYIDGSKLANGIYNSANLAIISGTGNLKVSDGISSGLWDGGGTDNNWSTGGNWDQNAVPVFPIGLTFAGNLRLANINDLSAKTVSSIKFDAAAGAFTLSGNDLTVTGDISFIGNPAAPVTQTINLNMTWSGNRTIDLPTNGNLTLGGSLALVNNLTKTGNGTLTLGGVDSFSSLIANGGTTAVTGNSTVTGAGGLFYLGNGRDLAGCNATLVIQPGASLTVNGSFNDSGVIGRDSGSATVIQNGGTFTFGAMDNSAKPLTLFVGATSLAGTRAEYDMNGGVLDMSGCNLGVALGDRVGTTGVVNQVGGVILNVNALQLGALTASGNGIFNLSGGNILIGAGGITSVSGLYAVNLGGGTVGAAANWSSLLNINLTGSNGPVKFDPAGNTITLSGVLSGQGGLSKIGNGTLELAGANTYTGDSIVNGGILKLDMAGGNLTSALRVTTGGKLNLSYSGSYVVGHFYTNGVALPNGAYTASNLGAFITGTGTLTVGDIIFATQPQNQFAYLKGTNNQVTLTFSTVGATATYQWYRNGQPVSGATGTSLTLSGIEKAGDYYVVATSATGSVTSATVTFTVYGANYRVFAYDGFDYVGSSDASTPVDGVSQNGGFGWAAAWQPMGGNAAFSDVAEGSLTGDANVPAGFDARAIGNSLEIFGGSRVGRFFDCSATSALAKQGFIDASGHIGANGRTIYLSFLQQPDRAGSFYELELHRGDLGDPGRMGGIGDDTGSGDVNLRAGGANNLSLGAGATGVNFYVVRIDYKAGNDDVFVYRNPTSTAEPATPTLTVSNAADMSLDGVSVAAFNGPDVKLDEIRLGATWEDALGLAVSNLLPPTRTANGYKIRFACSSGYSYKIQRAAEVTGPWADLATLVAPDNAYVEYEDTHAPAGRSFYRTILQ